jgi:hypothetical protein
MNILLTAARTDRYRCRQFSLRAILITIFLLTLGLAWSRLERPGEVDLGTFAFVVPQTDLQVECSFEIEATSKRPKRLRDRLDRRTQDVRRQVELAIRSSLVRDLLESDLAQLKSDLQLRINRVVGEGLVDQINFSLYLVRSGEKPDPVSGKRLKIDEQL